MDEPWRLPAEVMCRVQHEKTWSSGQARVYTATVPGPKWKSWGTIVIAPGATVADLIAHLGKPTMVLKGIGGNGYNEKYTFRKPDGTKFTVLALHGTITAVIDNSTRLPMRASLP